MNRLTVFGLTFAALGMMVFSFACALKNCPVNPPNPTFTPTFTSTITATPTKTVTPTPTFTSTLTPTNSPSNTPTNSATNTPSPSPTNTPTATPTCYSYTDSYGSNTISNYDIYDGGWTPSTASAQSITITSGEFQVAPSGSTVYPYSIVNNATFNQSLGDYTVQADFNYGVVSGVFGVVCRATPASFYAYIFQWNGINGRWEIEKQKGVGSYYYVGTNSGSPYTLGTTVTLKLVVGPGNLFNAWAGATQIFTNVTDPGTTTPYTTGGAGIRAYNITSGNILHVKNFSSKTPSCP